jgi:hypothetical protein
MDPGGNVLATWMQPNTAGIPVLYQDCYNASTQQWNGADHNDSTNYVTSFASGFDALGDAWVILAQRFPGAGPPNERLAMMHYGRAAGSWAFDPYFYPAPPATMSWLDFKSAWYSGERFATMFFANAGSVEGSLFLAVPYVSSIDRSFSAAHPDGQVLPAPAVTAIGPEYDRVAAWNQPNGVYVRNGTAGGRWLFAPLQVVPSPNPSPYPLAIVMDDKSRATLVWIGENATLWATTYR